MHQIVRECIFSRLNYGPAMKPCHISVFCGAEINLLCLLNKPVSLPLYIALLTNGCHRLKAAIKLVSIKKKSVSNKLVCNFNFYHIVISLHLFVF